MVLGREINEVQDASGKITISVWKATDILTGPHDFQIDVGDGWVCIGGGATGRELGYKGGPDFSTTTTGANYLTASFPSLDTSGQVDWKGWRVLSKDHIYPSPFSLIGYAIGMKHQDLTRDELISNLHVFRGIGMAVPHPELRVYLEQGFLRSEAESMWSTSQ